MDKEFTGKVAVVTGASSGIGRAMTRELVQRGCRVAMAARSQDALSQIAEEIGENAIAVPTDVADSTQAKALIETTIDSFGRIDIMFANAGLFSMTHFAEVDLATIDNLLDVNVRGVMYCVHAALPHLIGQGQGDILIVGSIAGVTELPNEAVYSPTKFAMQSFAHVLRRQVRQNGVRVGIISPGTVATELWGITTEAGVQERVDRLDAVRAEDVVEAALFMLNRPRHVAIRDLVILPQGQDV